MRTKNIAWNLVGLAGPLAVAALTIPSLIRLIGLERFGLLGLAWGLIGFAGIFDLGIGRATTQTVSRLRGENKLADVPTVLKTASKLAIKTGMAGAALLALAVYFGVHTLINFSPNLLLEVTISAYLLAVTIPIQSQSAMYRGVNEAFENFQGISLVKIGLGIANFLGPFLIAQVTQNLAILVGTLFASRLAALLAFKMLSERCLLREHPTASRSKDTQRNSEIEKRLLSFGGWVTVSSIVSPLLVQSDRFLIGALISASAIATYTIPYEVVTQTLILSSAISSVAFPSLSKLIHSQSENAEAMFKRWLLRVIVIMLTSTIAIAILLPYILPIWIGKSLPEESIYIGQILCLGVFFNSIGSMYFAKIHAHGHADITAKLHILELPIYIFILLTLLQKVGVTGAAAAWTGRMVLDTSLLYLANRRLSRLR